MGARFFIVRKGDYSYGKRKTRTNPAILNWNWRFQNEFMTFRRQGGGGGVDGDRGGREGRKEGRKGGGREGEGKEVRQGWFKGWVENLQDVP